MKYLILNKSFPLGAVMLICIVSGCAVKFKPLRPDDLVYSKPQVVNDSLRISYAYDVQGVAGNHRYSRKELSRSMTTVGIKIENLSPNKITITSDNLEVSSAGGKKTIISPKAYSDKIRQHVGGYLVHSLWGPWSISWETNQTTGQTEVSGFYLPVGLIVGIGNALRASNANHANLHANEQFRIWDKEIKPRGTLYGLLPLQTKDWDPLIFSYHTFSTNVPKHKPEALKINGPFKAPRESTVSLPHNFLVVLSNDKSFTCYSKIDISTKDNFLKASIDGVPTLIRPADTKSISCRTPEGIELLGIPADSCWTFKVISGRINGYYFLAEESHTSVSHIQKANGPIVPFTVSAMQEMVGDDSEINKLLSRQKYIKAILAYNEKY